MPSSPFLLPLLLLLAGSTDSLTLTPDCQESCGGVDIPYPFGIGPGCFRRGFEIICNTSSASDVVVPVLATSATDGQVIQVLNLSVSPIPEARVLLPVAWQCFNSTGGLTGRYSGNVDFNHEGVYRISNTQNELYVLGCNTLVYTKSGKRDGGRFQYASYTGCVSVTNYSSDPQDGACAGLGCCHVDIPPGLTDTTMSMASGGDWSHANQEFCPCDYAFIVEKGKYTFRADDLTTSIMRNRTMPLVLDWAIRDQGSRSVVSCAQAEMNKTDYACLSTFSNCTESNNGPGYVCNCTKGFEGNPYVKAGCTNINESTRPEEFPCHGECIDTEGSYECKCRPGYESDGDPKEQPCNPKFSRSAKLYIGIGVGTFLFIVTLLVTWLICKQKELKAKKKELEAAMERKNGNDKLQNVKTLKIFTKEELDKITDNDSSPLGHGGFGQVYKGTLSDKTEVAVKASIKVTEYTQDEFVREVEIQSRMMHRNILKLLGCCLRVDVPLLVYEYAAKGSLQDILHGKENQQLEPLTLNTRLDIAIGSAQGLAYMHSYTENGIQHADVKPDNILLDAGLVPKISDFGLSKILTAGKNYTMHVIGCEAYMDPVYRRTGRITPKSDVYSFGVVLLEMISRIKPIEVKYEENSLVVQFKRVYEKDNSGRLLFDKDIAKEENIHILDEIGMLAMKCLEKKVEDRPAMVSVASALVMLKDSWEYEKLHKGSISLTCN